MVFEAVARVYSIARGSVVASDHGRSNCELRVTSRASVLNRIDLKCGRRSSVPRVALGDHEAHQYVREQEPERLFTSLAVLYDQEAKHHRDAGTGNEEIPHVILKASSFEGGELWIEDPLGPDVMDLDGRMIAGDHPIPEYITWSSSTPRQLCVRLCRSETTSWFARQSC